MHPESIMLEKDADKRNRAVDEMTEQEAKDFLKRLLSVMNGEHRTEA